MTAQTKNNKNNSEKPHKIKSQEAFRHFAVAVK